MAPDETGLPIGTQFALEMGVFAATGLLIGNYDTMQGSVGGDGPSLGGHQIALQLASLSFMVPLGLGMAASVRVVGQSGAATVTPSSVPCRSPSSVARR